MFLAIVYLFIRPFVRAGLAKRHQLAAQQRSHEVARKERMRVARANGPVQWTPEEKQYLAAHAVSPYR